MSIEQDFTRQIIEPLCDETKKLFEPFNFDPHDRLTLDLTEDGNDFLATVSQRRPSIKFELPRRPGSHYWVSSGGVIQGPLEDSTASKDARIFWWKRIPEREKRSEGKWVLAGTDFTAIIINALWSNNQIVFKSKHAKILYRFLLARFADHNIGASMRAKFRSNKGMKVPRNFIDSAEYPLADFQAIAVESSFGRSTALFMEQGTGKTPCSIARICNESERMTENRMYRVLIVCPKSVRTNWRLEFQKFATRSGKVTTLRGGKLDRVKSLIEAMAPDEVSKWTAVICSYSVMVLSLPTLKALKWDLIILDESHNIKSPKSQRAKAALELREVATYCMTLTGTPVTNSLLDLWTQLEFLGRGLSGFASFSKFKNYYGRWIKRGPIDVNIGWDNIPILQERLARLAFAVSKKEALPDLPDKVRDVIEVSMTKKQMDIYKSVRTQILTEIKAELASGGNQALAIQHVFTRLLRLAQITSGYVSWDAKCNAAGEVLSPRTIEEFLPNVKLDTLMKILKDKTPQQKTIVWTCWRQNLAAIEKRAKAAGIDCVIYHGSVKDADRDLAVQRFNCDPKCTLFIGNPAAGGIGLNLLGYDPLNPDDYDTNCDHVLYFSSNWSMVDRSQSEDRAHRLGTRVTVRYTDLMVPCSIDEEIRIRVLEKRTSAIKLQDVSEMLQTIANADLTMNGD